MNRRALTLLVLLPLTARAVEPEARIDVRGEQANLLIGDELVARYHFGASVAKPYFWPVNAPGRVAVTRGWPMVNGLPKETNDHVHQKSAWFCHGDVIPEGVSVVPSSDKHVKGVDFWSEGKGHGQIVCVEARAGAPGSGAARGAGMTSRNEWRDAGGTKILDETRSIYLRPLGPGRLITLEIDLHASVCPLTFGDTKEGSMGVRVNDQIRLTARGEHSQMVNAGGTSGEKGAWGMLSDWCDYSGEIDGKHAGIAIFDAATNQPRSAWHARGYGLMAANPFGRNGSGFPARKGHTDLFKLDKGEHLKLRYGIYVHSGDAKSGKVAEAYAEFSKIR